MFCFCCGRILLASAYYKNLDSQATVQKTRDRAKEVHGIVIQIKVLLYAPWGEAEWAIDPWPLRGKGLIILVSPY